MNVQKSFVRLLRHLKATGRQIKIMSQAGLDTFVIRPKWWDEMN